MSYLFSLRNSVKTAELWEWCHVNQSLFSWCLENHHRIPWICGERQRLGTSQLFFLHQPWFKMKGQVPLLGTGLFWHPRKSCSFHQDALADGFSLHIYLKSATILTDAFAGFVNYCWCRKSCTSWYDGCTVVPLFPVFHNSVMIAGFQQYSTREHSPSL